jgi:predicted nucleotide-binding protein (sugar kinase/HSP70/actin superfamily)
MEPLADFVYLNSFGCGPDAIVIDEIKSILETYSLSPVILKIDEITSIGSAKLRIRSLLESKSTPFQIRLQSPRRKLPVFAKKDRHRTILVPDFSPFYSMFTQAAFTSMGYTIETLPPPDKESVRTGLQYLNNDICYPAVITIGDIIKALQSGTYDPDKIAVGLTETGGPCRATNYISILKKALLSAGYGNIPVISATTNKKSLNDQPGFVVNKPKLICLIFSSLMMVDQLVRMFHATAVRETTPGQSLAALRTHLDYARKRLGTWTMKNRTSLLERAIEDFNAISAFTGMYPKAGLVGEIYVKYNPFSNGNIVERLMRNGIQVVMPPLITFFLQNFINIPFNHDNHIERAGIIDRQLLRFYQYFIENKIVQVNRLMTRFKHTLDPVILPQMLSVQAKKVVNLCNQAGEGWLLPGEIAAMFESGIRNIICLQPFGCIANHVVGKGISSKLSKLYPELNLLNLDMDAGNSDANIQNRLDFFIHAARDQTHRSPGLSSV